MTWPSVVSPATAPTEHGYARTQAYYAGGGDYFRSGYYHLGTFASGTVGSFSPGTSGRMHLRAFLVPVRRSFDRIGVHVTGAAASLGDLRMGIYSGPRIPTTLIVDGGVVAATTTGAKEATISVSLDPGLYWLAVAFQGANATSITTAGLPSNHWHPYASGVTAPPSAAGLSTPGSYSVNGVTGALPASPTIASESAAAPLACLRAA